MADRIAFTERRLAEATCPDDRSERLLWDTVQPGLVVRVRRSGGKVYVLRYRPKGAGRLTSPVRLTIGTVGTISLAKAREIAKGKLGEVAGGADPHREQRAVQIAVQGTRASAAIDLYETDMKRRQLVEPARHAKHLRDELQRPLGDPKLQDLTRRQLVERIREMEAEGLPGKAAGFRTRAAVFLNWCVNEGLMTASPLAGLRKPRASKAERVAPKGRALPDAELAAAWKAADQGRDPIFAAYFRALILTGQRRTETALMEWPNLDLDAGRWTIPAKTTKAGRPHIVPLPPELVTILESLPKIAGTDLVFPGRSLKTMSGWAKRVKPVTDETAKAGIAPWSLHDLRRTMRTGLAMLKVPPHVAERMLNHAVKDALSVAYDHHDYWPERVEAAQAWARKVMAAVEGTAERKRAGRAR